MPRLVYLAAAAALALPCTAHALPVDTVVSPLGVRLDSALRAAERRGFSGVVRIEKAGQLLLAKGYGVANRESKIPFRRSTVVQIGSNTKDFTLVALLRLQSRGRLDLRDSLGKYFPAAPADKRGITLQQLVDHRGGFPIGLGADFDTVSRDGFVRMALAAPLRAAPGTREIYSNPGYALLAAVIEQVAGTSYDRFIRDDLLAPLGLTEIGYLLPGFPRDRVAHGYRNGTGQGNILEKPHAPDGPYWNLRGNGGMLATVDAMHEFYRVLFETERLLPRNARGGRFSPTEPVGLAGSDLVHFFLFERLPVEGVEMIIATNSTDVRAPMIRDEIASVLGLARMQREGGQTAAAPPVGATPPAPAAASVVRTFFAAVNGVDTAAVRAFVVEHFVPGGATVDERAERFSGMRERLGTLTPGASWADDKGMVSVSVTTKEGPATFIFDMTAGAAPKIRTVRVMVGG